MEPKMLDAAKHVDPDTGVLSRYIRSDTEYFRPHNHNYYELFLIVKGHVCHLVNGKTQLLNEGQLLFIRDFDLHDYISSDGNYFEFVNLAFSKDTMNAMISFLGEGFPIDKLMTVTMPPMVSLSIKEKEKLSYRFIELNENIDKEYLKFKARSFLVYVFSTYFVHYTEQISEIPAWLEIVYQKMKYPQNFILGTKRMYQLSGKSREHLTRCMKQHYGITPTAYISELRLEHAANLLHVSNLSVTDICYECGFDNLSWFYKSFTGKYGVTPVEYRKQQYTKRDN